MSSAITCSLIELSKNEEMRRCFETSVTENVTCKSKLPGCKDGII